MEKGMIHIYCGEGKGKTTTAMGLSIRAAGYGLKVLIYQFMKDNNTSERKVLDKISNITLIDGLKEEKFSFQMSEEEKKKRKEFYTKQFKYITDLATKEKYDVIVMDEILYTINAGLIDEKLVVDYLKSKPNTLEIVLTGNPPSNELVEMADYVSKISKIKHPFDNGQKARYGIEK